MTTRQEKILACIDPATQIGLEIGALNKPIVTPEMGDICYVDYATTEELRQKYAADPNVEIEKIVEVSYIWGEKRLIELVGETRFDYAIASHVVEHVPDFIGWLKEIHAVLKPGGTLSLAIPDKRYCFDYLRQPTHLAEMIEAYLQGSRKPSSRQIFEFEASHSSWKGQFCWSPQDSVTEKDIVHSHSTVDAWNITQTTFSEQSYYDVHCWAFTPRSFFDLFKQLIEIQLVDFRIVKCFETVGCEFHVSLEALDLMREQTERCQSQLESLSEITLPDETLPQAHEERELTTELAGQREHTQLVQVKLERLRADKQRLRRKVQDLQTSLENRESEIAAMQSSKFWKIRSGWLSMKKMIGIRGE